MQHLCCACESALKRASFLPVQKPGFYAGLGRVGTPLEVPYPMPHAERLHFTLDLVPIDMGRYDASLGMNRCAQQRWSARPRMTPPYSEEPLPGPCPWRSGAQRRVPKPVIQSSRGRSADYCMTYGAALSRHSLREEHRMSCDSLP